MRQTVVPSQYLQIALDLATRIARGELAEGSRIYGRSVMASEYNVSPETIRRALRLLADMKVVEGEAPERGGGPLRRQRPPVHRELCRGCRHPQSLRLQLRDLLAESAEVNRRMAETVSALVKGTGHLRGGGRTAAQL